MAAGGGAPASEFSLQLVDSILQGGDVGDGVSLVLHQKSDVLLDAIHVLVPILRVRHKGRVRLLESGLQRKKTIISYEEWE